MSNIILFSIGKNNSTDRKYPFLWFTGNSYFSVVSLNDRVFILTGEKRYTVHSIYSQWILEGNIHPASKFRDKNTKLMRRTRIQSKSIDGEMNSLSYFFLQFGMGTSNFQTAIYIMQSGLQNKIIYFCQTNDKVFTIQFKAIIHQPTVFYIAPFKIATQNFIGRGTSNHKIVVTKHFIKIEGSCSVKISGI